MEHVKIVLDAGTRAPTRGTEGSVGWDLYCRGFGPVRSSRAILVEKGVLLPPGSGARIRSGLRIALPEGIFAEIRPRSSSSLRGLFIPTGTIDTDYLGELAVVAWNVSDEPIHVALDERIAQLVFLRTVPVAVEEVDSFEVETTRGERGFGSTGAF